MHDFIPSSEEGSNEDNLYDNYVYKDEDSDQSEYELEGFENIKPSRIRFRRDLEEGFDMTQEEMDMLKEITSYDESDFDNEYSSSTDISSDVEYHYEPEWEID